MLAKVWDKIGIILAKVIKFVANLIFAGVK
jgi:hypothetical protein